MKRILGTIILMVLSFWGYTQDTIPNSYSDPLYGVRQYVSMNGSDTAALYYNGDTAIWISNDSLNYLYIKDTLIARNYQGITGTDVKLNEIDTATYDDVQDWLNNTQSVGLISGGGFTDNGDGTVTIASGTGFIKTTDNILGITKFFDWNETDVTPSDGNVNHVYVDYNSGSPIVNITTDKSTVTHTTKFLIGKIYQNGNTAHFLEGGTQVFNLARRTQERLGTAEGFKRVSGMVTSETGTRNVAITAGRFFLGLNDFSSNSFDSNSGDSFSLWDKNGGTWEEAIGETTIPETYDDGDGTPESLGNKNFGVFWVYLHEDNDVHIVFETEDFRTAALAGASSPRVDLPDKITSMGILIAQVIIAEDDADGFEAVYTPWGTTFIPSLVTDHGNLEGLDDPTDHPWALQWSDTIADIATKYDIDTVSGGGSSLWTESGDYIRNTNTGDRVVVNTYYDSNTGIDFIIGNYLDTAKMAFVTNTSANDGDYYFSLGYNDDAARTAEINVKDTVQFDIKHGNSTYLRFFEDTLDVNQYTRFNAGSNVSSLWTESGSDIYYNSGNVGIGTSSPGKRLDVTYDNDAKEQVLRVNNNNPGTSSASMINVTGYSNTLMLQSYGDNHSSYAGENWIGTVAGNTDVSLFRGSTKRLTIGGGKNITDGDIYINANVGIGTTSPSYKLDVDGGIARRGLWFSHLGVLQEDIELGINANIYTNVDISDANFYSKIDANTLQIQKTGTYKISYRLNFKRYSDAGSTANHNIIGSYMKVNAANRLDESYSTCHIANDQYGNQGTNNVTFMLSLTSGDNIELYCYEDKGWESGTNLVEGSVSIEFVGN